MWALQGVLSGLGLRGQQEAVAPSAERAVAPPELQQAVETPQLLAVGAVEAPGAPHLVGSR